MKYQIFKFKTFPLPVIKKKQIINIVLILKEKAKHINQNLKIIQHQELIENNQKLLQNLIKNVGNKRM